MHFQTIVQNYGQLSLFIWENSSTFAHRSNETMFNYLVQTAMKTNELQGSEALLLVRKQLASCYSTAAQVMYEFDLKKVVQIYLPSCSDAQFHALMHFFTRKIHSEHQSFFQQTTLSSRTQCPTGW